MIFALVIIIIIIIIINALHISISLLTSINLIQNSIKNKHIFPIYIYFFFNSIKNMHIFSYALFNRLDVCG